MKKLMILLDFVFLYVTQNEYNHHLIIQKYNPLTTSEKNLYNKILA